MRLAHCADLHVGFRAHDRVDAEGANVRERDVEQTFVRLVDGMIACAPDCILIAGDVVHTPRPTNRTIITVLREFARLRQALPNTPIVIAAGNHDLSPSRDAKCILEILEGLGLHIAMRDAKRFYFPALELSVLAVPDAPGERRPVLSTDARAKYSVLCLHGEAAAATQVHEKARQAALEISNEELNAPVWSYVGMGHYHQFEQLAPNAFYAGSIDFTSSDPWKEIGTPKGFIEFDLKSRTHTFHTLAPSRRHLDLSAIDGAEMGHEQLMATITAAIADSSIDDAVLRLVVTNVTREVGRALDHRLIRSWKRRALNFNLDIRRPARAPQGVGRLAPVYRQRSLQDIVTDHLATRSSDLSPERLTSTALSYLDRAMDQDAPRTITEAAA